MNLDSSKSIADRKPTTPEIAGDRNNCTSYHSTQVFIPRGEEVFNEKTFLHTRRIENTPVISLDPFIRGPDKPDNGFWTSSLKEFGQNGKKTTEWLNWCRNNQPKSVGKFAVLFHVSGDAKIFSVDSHSDPEYLNNNFPHPRSNKLTDWVDISSQYDAVHCTKYLLSEWSCESTLWFNTDKLKRIKTFKIQEGAIETDNSVDVNNGNLLSRPTEQGGAVKVESRNPDSGASGVTAQTLQEDFDGISLLPSNVESKQSKPTISPVKNEQLPSEGGMARFFRILFHAALESFYLYLNSYH